MSVWVTVPSARPPEVVAEWAKAWRERGYKIALWREHEAPLVGGVHVTLRSLEYPGYAKAVNHLVAQVRDSDPQAEWFVIGGDDVFPDPNHSAEEIARECCEYFVKRQVEFAGDPVPYEDGQLYRHLGTYGVMQPTGDRWGVNPDHPNPAMRSAYIDRVCGSAWIGREFAKRVNGGRGPLWSGNPAAESERDRKPYMHMFVDEELQAVATKLGVLWQRPDLLHHHAHAGRVKNYDVSMIPPHLKKWTTGPEGRAHWQESEALYKRREAAGFPGSEPL